MRKKKEEVKKEDSPVINIWGWDNIDAVAEDIYQGIHSQLLEGYLVFAYQGGSDDLRRFVITQKSGVDTYMLGVITSGYTMLLPSTPKEYLVTEFMEDLRKKYKIHPDILNNLEKILQ